MKRAHVSEFMDDFKQPVLFVDPLHDTGLNTLHGERADVQAVQDGIRGIIGDREPNTEFTFTDTTKTVATSWLLDRFEDITGGLHPGNPTLGHTDHTPRSSGSSIGRHVTASTSTRLQRFYDSVGISPPRFADVHAEPTTPDTATMTSNGVTSILKATLELPAHNTKAKAYMHEIGHCTMGLIGFSHETTTIIDEDNPQNFRVSGRHSITTLGLKHVAENELRGTILEEGVAESLGSLINDKLRIVTSDDPSPDLPEDVQRYKINGHSSASAPTALALELIAKEIGMPFDAYLRLAVNYANAGVHDTDARQEFAETINKGTRGKLTLAQVEGLPYPLSLEARLVLLRAVEWSLDVPSHAQYSQHFLP